MNLKCLRILSEYENSDEQRFVLEWFKKHGIDLQVSSGSDSDDALLFDDAIPFTAKEAAFCLGWLDNMRYKMLMAMNMLT
jgi:hypothetical protein